MNIETNWFSVEIHYQNTHKNMAQTAEQQPLKVEIVRRNFYKEALDEIAAAGGYPQQTTPLKNWLVYALKEPAIKRGTHVRLISERKAWRAVDEKDLLTFCNLPTDQGGPGYYKVIHYCDMDSTQEVLFFNRAVERFKLLFRPDTPGNLDV